MGQGRSDDGQLDQVEDDLTAATEAEVVAGGGVVDDGIDDDGPLDRARSLLGGIGDSLVGGLRAVPGLNRLPGLSQARVGVDADPAAELVDDDVEDDVELAALDRQGRADREGGEDGGHAALDLPDIDLPEGFSLWGLFDEIDPRPEEPLTGPHTAGLGALLHRALEAIPGSTAVQDWAVERILGLVGDRYSVTVGPDGVTVRGLLRRRHTPWESLHAVEIISRYDALQSGLVSELIDSVVRYPVPGLRWLVSRIFGFLGDRLEDLVLDEGDADRWRDESGPVVVALDRKGFDIELGGPLFLVSMLAKGTTAAIVDGARVRGVTVEEPR